MSDPRVRRTQGPLLLRAESGKIFTPDQTGSILENFTETPEGTLTKILGPVPVVPAYSGGAAQPQWREVNGVFHARLLQGQMDMLLVVGRNENADNPSGVGRSQVFILDGPNRQFTTVSSEFPLGEALKPKRFPAQFEATPNGIVIIPQDTAQALFLDADFDLEPLGYYSAPGAPDGQGPDSDGWIDSAGAGTGLHNTGNYAHDGYIFSDWESKGTQMHEGFGRSRLGTLHSSPTDGAHDISPAGSGTTSAGFNFYTEGNLPGALLKSGYQASCAYVDKWGNISPLSPRSNMVYFSEQAALGPLDAAYGSSGGAGNPIVTCPIERLQKQIFWDAVSIGPQRTVGRILFRSKDLLNSGESSLFAVPPNSLPALNAFATLPDNRCTFYPDNIPDAWLLEEAPDLVPMQRFRLCRMAFGRMFYANAVEDTGLVRWSLPGRWGTLSRFDFVYPDADGREVTGMFAVPGGMLVFTRYSTFLMTDTSAATGFAFQKISSHAGCVAPSSIAMTKNGTVIWLGVDGFYSYGGGQVQYFSEAIRPTLKYINRALDGRATASFDPTSGEYRCWVAMDASLENNVCWIYDSQGPNVGWRRRTDIAAAGSCITQDHRKMNIVVGTAGTENLNATPYSAYVLDHRVSTASYAAPSFFGIIETAWLLNENDYTKKSPFTVYFWFRETSSAQVKVTLYRDWRKLEVEQAVLDLHPVSDPPPFWGATELGAGETIRKRRPYWSRAAIFIPSCEVFKVSVASGPDAEFIGISFDYQLKPSGGARIQP